MPPPELSAQVECGKGFKASTGTLSLSNDQLRFETDEGAAFDLPLSSVPKLIWHWYSFSAAFETTIDGKNYFISFMPRGAGLATWYESLATGRKWRAALEGRPLPTGSSIFSRIFMAAFWLIRLFFLVISAILCLAAAIDETASQTSRILSGVMAALVTFYMVMFVVVGFQSLRTPKQESPLNK